jgi:hypothetical protein
VNFPLSTYSVFAEKNVSRGNKNTLVKLGEGGFVLTTKYKQRLCRIELHGRASSSVGGAA